MIERPFKQPAAQEERGHGGSRVGPDRPGQGRPAHRGAGGGARAQAPGLDRVPRDRRTPRRGWGGLVVASLTPARDLHRSRRRQPDLGHRRQRVRRLPPRLRRDGRRPRSSRDRRGDPTTGVARDAFRAADQAPRCGRREPRRTLLAAAVAVLQLGDRGDARSRPPDAREDRTRPPDQDRGDLPRPPRFADVQRDPRPRPDGAAGAPGDGSPGARHPDRRSPTWSASCRSTTWTPPDRRSRSTGTRWPA